MNIWCEQVDNPPRRAEFEKRIGILIPAFNEAGHLGKLLAACRSLRPAVVVVIDDASTDATPEVLERVRICYSPSLPLVVLRNPRNLGKQGAVRRGLKELTEWDLDGVALLDGDGQHDPAELPALASLLDRFDLIIGARRKNRMPFQRRLSNWLVNRGFEWIGGVDFVDVQSGLRLYRKWLVDVLADRLPPDGGYALEHESLTVMARYGRDNRLPIRVAAAPASCSYGPQTSSMQPEHMVDLALQTLRQAVRFRRATQDQMAVQPGL